MWPPLGIRVGTAEYETACADGRHEWRVERTRENEQGEDEPLTWICTLCNAWLGEHGQESTPERFVWHVVWWARSLRRVLRDDALFFLNIGDTFFTDPGGQNGGLGTTLDYGKARISAKVVAANRQQGRVARTAHKHPYLKPGDQVGIPDMVRRALLEDGWRRGVRMTLVKSAPMPQSVQGVRWERCRVKVAPSSAPVASGAKQASHPNRTVAGFNERWAASQKVPSGWAVGRDDHSVNGRYDNSTAVLARWADCPGCPRCEGNDGLILRRGAWRPTSATEVLFLFAKSDRYYADQEAVRVPLAAATVADGRMERGQRGTKGQYAAADGNAGFNPAGRNAWDWMVWSPQPSTLAHYASYPTHIPEFAIRVGTAEKVCGTCRAPYARVVERRKHPTRDVEAQRAATAEATGRTDGHVSGPSGLVDSVTTVGWRPTCACRDAAAGRSIVLDPFSGSGTTLVVASRLGRDGIGIELQPEYVSMSEKRLHQDAPLFAEVHTNGSGAPQAAQLDLFAAPPGETGGE